MPCIAFLQLMVTEHPGRRRSVLKIEGYDDLWEDLSLFMDTNDENHRLILGTSYVLPTSDADTLSETSISTDNFIIVQRHDPA